jgi:uncharacterized membrane protein YgdD (TMEM256/DUF423 family)
LHTRTVGLLASLFGLAGVALGAFGAHGLRGRLVPGDMAIFETAVRYQLLHALALLGLAALQRSHEDTPLRLAAWAFVAGILAFCGSLYALVLTGGRWLGAVTPLGGVSFLIGWSALAWGFLRERYETAAEPGGGKR